MTARVRIASAIFVAGNRVLLVQQRKEVAYGLWNYPGGRMEAGESPLQAATREVAEEIGVTLQSSQLLGIYDAISKDKKLQIHSFTGDFNGEIKLKEDELLAYGWFTLAELEQMADQLRSPTVLQQAKDALSRS